MTISRPAVAESYVGKLEARRAKAAPFGDAQDFSGGALALGQALEAGAPG
jgi:hypothetical protein